MAAKESLTPEQLEQHSHVLSVAKQNLELVINQVESLDHQIYDELLESLDNAKTVLEGRYGKTQEAISKGQA